MSQLYTKEVLRAYLAHYHHLSTANPLSHEDIPEYVAKVGCIQYDPLDVVGRNSDLVLQARCAQYQKGDIEPFLYNQQVLFDVWDKNMAIACVADWPYFTHYRQYYLSWCEEHEEAVKHITQYLMEHEYACSSDFELEERVGWHYGPQRLAKAALECMCYAGLAVVHHKKHTRRYYALAQRMIPKDILRSDAPYHTDTEYFRIFTLRRIKSIGALWNRPSDAWLGTQGYKTPNRQDAFQYLLEENFITPIQVEDVRHALYVPTESLLDLNAVQGSPKEDCVKFIAPLDNLLWDRRLVYELFGFAYRWEVYTPISQRKYGYYVLPMFLNGNFIGRIEMKTDKKTSTLIVQNIWMEDAFPYQQYQERIWAGLERFMHYNRCTALLDCTP